MSRECYCTDVFKCFEHIVACNVHTDSETPSEDVFWVAAGLNTKCRKVLSRRNFTLRLN
jgi:hypothetical protein